MKWVLIKKFVAETGTTDDAIRAKMARGVWLKGVHWQKAPDNRIYLNPEAIQKWIEHKV